jgi:DNA-binding transcriptional regulator YdaS (Cro superfamily)
MKLKRWLKLVGMKQTELAKLVGCSVATINRHIKHGRILDPEVVVRVYFITTGAVRPDDFYDLENIPPEIDALLNSAQAGKLRAPARQIISLPKPDMPSDAS